MKTNFVPRETEFQRWLDAFRIYCGSEDIELGGLYRGLAVQGEEALIEACRPSFYDAKRRVLLAEALDGQRCFFLHGRMYAYEGVLYCESYNSLATNKPLRELVLEAVESAEPATMTRELLIELLNKSLTARLSDKFAGYFKSSMEIAADAYLSGCLDT